MRDYYQILGLPPSASDQELKRRYRFLTQAYHPDKFRSPEHKAQGEAEVKVINEAYNVLIDPQKRRDFDASRFNTSSSDHKSQRRSSPPPPQPTPSNAQREGATARPKTGGISDGLIYKLLASVGLAVVVMPLVILEKCPEVQRRINSAPPRQERFIAPIEDRIAAMQMDQKPAAVQLTETQPPWTPPIEDLVVSVSFPKRFFPARSYLNTPVILHEDFTWSCDDAAFRRMSEFGAFSDSEFSAAILNSNHVFIDKYRRWKNPVTNDTLPFTEAFTVGFPGSTELGRLTIKNGTGKNAIVKLIEATTDSKACSLIVFANTQEKLTGVPDGRYRMLYALGTELIKGSDRFRTRAQSTSEFEEVFAFSSVPAAQGVRYSDITVTLHTVHGGRAKTEVIQERDFDRY
jgi:hypothetical protein